MLPGEIIRRYRVRQYDVTDAARSYLATKPRKAGASRLRKTADGGARPAPVGSAGMSLPRALAGVLVALLVLLTSGAARADEPSE
jgi:hypothetical protein